MEVICNYCGRSAQFVTGAVIYPHRPDLESLKFYQCKPCDAYVGVHKRNKKLGLNGDEPKGTLANSKLRNARSTAHASFDPLWKDGSMSRTQAYKWLSAATGIPVEQMHIAMLDFDGCISVINVCQKVTLCDRLMLKSAVR
jgi:hypothetical protein